MRRWPVLLVLLFPSVAGAHVRSVSWSTWTVRGGAVEGRVRIARLDADAVSDLDAHLRTHLRIGPDCVVDAPRSAPADVGFVVRSIHASCPAGAALRLESDLFTETISSHVHFAALERDGVVVAEQLLSRERRSWELPREPTAVRVSQMIALGVRHILSGADHMVFLLTLVLGTASLRGLVGVVTGFTLGHAAALALAVLYGVRPQPAAIEALVGATIAVVAVENLWLEGRDPWLPRALVVGLFALSLLSGLGAEVALGLTLFVACVFGLLSRNAQPTVVRGSMTALFGLVHGFAFSTALAELSLPRARLAPALFGFNVGVELGQLALIAMVWPAWRWLSRTRVGVPAREVASAAALATGVFWLVSRAV